MYNTEKASTIVGSDALPYLRSNVIVKEHVRNNNPKFNAYYYIPFYRYADNDYIIGFRKVFLTAFDKKDTNFEDNFAPRSRPFGDLKMPIPDTIIARNKAFDDIQKLCRQHKIDVVYFCAPYCDNLTSSPYHDLLKKKIPSLRDYSRAITKESYFLDCQHLNATGASLFTQMLIDDCLKKP
jgi:hypothetical protein